MKVFCLFYKKPIYKGYDCNHYNSREDYLFQGRQNCLFDNYYNCHKNCLFDIRYKNRENYLFGGCYNRRKNCPFKRQLLHLLWKQFILQFLQLLTKLSIRYFLL